jgi:hypothetical protein
MDEKFSAKRFESLGINSPEANRLASELETAVNEKLHQLIEPEFRLIIRALNSMGHNLKVDECEVGSIGYRDDAEEHGEYHCKLRLGVDVVVSAGYPDLEEQDEAHL